jgi:hypothetical protein
MLHSCHAETSGARTCALLTAAGQGAIKRAMKTPFAIIGICIIG